MATSSTPVITDAFSDGQLIAMVRGGNLDAYDGLYVRHVSIASTVARKNVDNLSDADDVVAEAFQSVLQSLVAGKGPEHFFRAYLLSAVTRLSHHRNRKAGRILPSSDETVLDRRTMPDDPAIQAFESHTVARAFRTLPERWQSALWYLDVERMKPAAVAPILGLSPNAVSALGVRAREGLRRQYLQMHVKEISQGACTEFVSQLGSYLRGGLSRSAEAKVRGHLDGCAKCTAVLLDLKDVQGTMRVVLLPLITGVPLAAWGGSAPGLGVVGQLPAVPVSSGISGISRPFLMSVLATLAVGLIVGTVGVVDVLTGQPTPKTYQDAEIQATGTGQGTLPVSPTSTPPRLQTPSPPAYAVPEPSSIPTLPGQPEPSVPVEPPLVVPVPDPVQASPPLQTLAPTPAAMGLAKVGGTAKRTDSGVDTTTATIEIVFTLSRGNGLGKATASLSVDRRATISSNSVKAPTGWTCSATSLNSSSVTCTTDSVQAGELRFRLGINLPRHRYSHTLTYGLGGDGIDANTFYYDF